MMWDYFQNRLEFTAALVTQTGLRIGMGVQSAEPSASDLPVLRTIDGQPYIPGSSLRGVLRSHIERIVRTFEPITNGSYNGRGACSPVNRDEWCIKDDFVKSKRNELRGDSQRDKKFAEWVFERSCRVCRVFGSPWLASKVRISDLHCKTNDVQSEHRDGVAIDREKETVANKYDFEVVPKATRFQLEIIAENLDKLERGLVFLGIFELERGNIHVGGFKGRGLGRISIEDSQLKFLDAEKDRQALSRYLLEGVMPDVKVEQAQTWLDMLLQEMRGGGD